MLTPGKPLATEQGKILKNFNLEDAMNVLRKMWSDDQGQDVAEYALMLAVILVVVVASVKAIGTAANTVFTNTSNALN